MAKADRYRVHLDFAEAVIACLAIAAIGVAVGYFGCWTDSANRHIYTNRTVSTDAARTPRTPPGERSPARADESNGGGDARQRAAGWLSWLLSLAAAFAVGFWAAVELFGRRPRLRTIYAETVADGRVKSATLRFSEPTPTRKETDR